MVIFFNYLAKVLRLIYTTNTTEVYNYQLREVKSIEELVQDQRDNKSAHKAMRDQPESQGKED